MSAAPFIEVALICEDVRKEISGKEIIIGVLGGEVTIASFPATLILTLYLRVRFPSVDTFNMDVRVVGPPSTQPITPVVQVQIRGERIDRPATVALSGIPLQILSPGRLDFQWRPHGDSEWTSITGIDVAQGAVTTPGMVIGQATIAS